MAIGGGEPPLEILPRFGRSRGEPAADERRVAADVGGVPQPAAEQLYGLGISARRLDLSGDLLEPGAAFRQQQRIEASGRRRHRGWLGGALSTTAGQQALDCRRDIAGAGVEKFDLGHAAAAPRCDFAQRVGHQMPVRRVGRERRETGEAAFACIADRADHLLTR